MIFELASSAMMGGILLAAQMKAKGTGNDAQKIQTICANAGLTNKHGETIQLKRRTKKEWGMEYVYRIPLGLSFKDFQNKLHTLQDGLNAKDLILKWSDLREIQLRRDIIKQIRQLIKKNKEKHKEVELSWDGFLKIKVYSEKMKTNIPYDQDLLIRVRGWEVPVGMDRGDHLIKHDFEEIPHMVVGGGTRYGKSNYLNSLIVTLLKNHPDDVTFTLIDLKGGIEFSDYDGVKQVRNVAYEPEEALEALENAYLEMKEMQQRLRKMGKKKVQDAGIKKRHFVIIDEVGELNPAEAVSKEERELKHACQMYMSKFARLGAGLGFRQILATQYPTGDVIPRQCKQNSDAKLCFRVRNAVASNVVLDEAGAELLPRVKGRAIYQTDTRHIIQSAFIPEEEIRNTITPLINIRPRKEDPDAKSHSESGTGHKHTLIIEEA
ncbi:FtsK/SpoIIIE domain-containing protein [Metabacillus indicus]|uniref:FtsK/SpoIIIE domain-containing protein n=1 Tax=Metabacillus indicus TaxID=246786 RepID=UPI002A09B91B|nr:FtsK/SpoIIIE domain-containing protein [Metabacillus indicus]MDX8288818.1 FtsK/SpoIIIE domain-containing protein [Metabacillus indicus]